MDEHAEEIRVNFAQSFPVFPLGGVVLLPHAMLRLFIFEPRYRQMTEAVLDGAGQIAMAVPDPRPTDEDEDNPTIKPVVCVGQIVRHEPLPDGTYRLYLQGVCRARVVEEDLPEGDRLYRRARLQPIQPDDDQEDLLGDRRREIMRLISEPPLGGLESVREMRERLEDAAGGLDEIPTNVLLEVVALSVIGSAETPSVMYRLLEEGSPVRRADIIGAELGAMSRLLSAAERQFDPEAPPRITWN